MIQDKSTPRRVANLENQHADLDAQLQVLAKRVHLTPTAQVTATKLKKRKLSTKDRLADLRVRRPDVMG